MKRFLVLTSFIVYFTQGVSQGIYTGKIVDSDTNKPIGKAMISKVGDSVKTTSNHLGYFQVTAEASEHLIVEKEGYITSEVQIPEQAGFLVKIQRVESPELTAVLNDYEKGQLVNGYKAGIWEYYDEPGVVAVRVDYDN